MRRRMSASAGTPPARACRPRRGLRFRPCCLRRGQGYGMAWGCAKRGQPSHQGRSGWTVLDVGQSGPVAMAGTKQPVLHRPPIPVPEEELVQGLNREGIHALSAGPSEGEEGVVYLDRDPQGEASKVALVEGRSPRPCPSHPLPGRHGPMVGPGTDMFLGEGGSPPPDDVMTVLRRCLDSSPSDKDGRAGRHRGVMTSRREGGPAEPLPGRSQAGASSTSLTRAGSILIPGPMVVETVTLRRYRPLAPAGLARSSSSITVR
jgi:hypothetical protein